MSDLSNFSTQNQKEMMLKLFAPSVEKSSNLQNLEASDSETENIFAALTSIPIET